MTKRTFTLLCRQFGGIKISVEVGLPGKRRFLTPNSDGSQFDEQFKKLHDGQTITIIFPKEVKT